MRCRDAIPQLWPDFLLKEEHSWFSHHHVLCVFTHHFSPGADENNSPGVDVNNSPGVTSTETGPTELSCASANPQPRDTIFPRGVHQVGAGALRAPTDMPATSGLPDPAQDPMTAPALEVGFLHPDSEPKTPFNDVKPGGVLQAEVGWRAQRCSLPVPDRFVLQINAIRT